MLAIFNNTQYEWKVNDLRNNNGNTPSSRKISVGVKIPTGYRGLSFQCPADSEIGEVNQYGVADVYTGKTDIFFDNKHNSPNFSASKNVNKDILLIALDIKGQRVVDITKQDIFVLSYAIGGGALFIALSVKDTCNTFNITTYNEDAKEQTVYTFNVNHNLEAGTLAERVEVTNTVYVGAAKPERPFKICKFRPSRPTYLVFARRSDEADVNVFVDNEKDKTLTKNGNEIVYYTDIDDLGSKVSKYVKADGYTAATLYTNLESMSDDDFGDYNDEVFTLRNAFKMTNIMLGAKTPVGFIKR